MVHKLFFVNQRFQPTYSIFDFFFHSTDPLAWFWEVVRFFVFDRKLLVSQRCWKLFATARPSCFCPSLFLLSFERKCVSRVRIFSVRRRLTVFRMLSSSSDSEKLHAVVKFIFLFTIRRWNSAHRYRLRGEYPSRYIVTSTIFERKENQ